MLIITRARRIDSLPRVLRSLAARAHTSKAARVAGSVFSGT